MTSDEEKLKSAIKFISLNNELNKRKRDLDKAIISNDKEEIEHKRKIYEKVKETRNSYVEKR